MFSTTVKNVFDTLIAILIISKTLTVTTIPYVNGIDSMYEPPCQPLTKILTKRSLG